jgi:hypothetical protein
MHERFQGETLRYSLGDGSWEKRYAKLQERICTDL